MTNQTLQINSTCSLCEYDVVCQIGQGGDSQIFLTRHRKQDQLFVLKVYNKQQNQFNIKKVLKSVRNEHYVLQTVQNPFIIKLYNEFQDFQNIYFVFEFCKGGDLYMNSMKQQLTTPEIVQIAAQLILAIEALHQQNIIYRDLRPENVVFDDRGYIRLIDFARSKHSFRKEPVQSNKRCGNVDYLAPEQISKKQTYDKAVDIWQLGVLIYEISTQQLPFYSDNLYQTQKNILNQEPQYPSFLQQQHNLYDLIQACLTKDKNQRITIQQLKQHKIFKNLNFKILLQKSLQLEFNPQQNYKQNFLQELVNKQINVNCLWKILNKTQVVMDVRDVEFDDDCLNKIIGVENQECLIADAIIGMKFNLLQKLKTLQKNTKFNVQNIILQMQNNHTTDFARIIQTQENRKFLKFLKVGEGNQVIK